jgi:hypothetical protein
MACPHEFFSSLLRVAVKRRSLLEVSIELSSNMTYSSSPLRVKVPRECYVPTHKHKIVEALLKTSQGEERQMFQDFCRMVEAIYHFENHRMANELKQDYGLFHALNGHGIRDGLSDEQLAAAEDRFLLHFRTLMEKGNFRPLTQEDIEVADAEDYLFDLPVHTDWKGLDSQMLSRFFEKHLYARQGEPPEFAHRILIYRRGVGVDRTRGFLILHKIDALISMILLGLWSACRALGSLAARTFGLSKPRLTAENALETAGGVPLPESGDPSAAVLPKHAAQSADSREELPQSTWELPQSPSPLKDVSGQREAAASGPSSSATCASSSATNHESHQQRPDRYIERKTLRSTGVTPLSLFRRTELQEPTFKELIILFRFAATPPLVRGESPQKDWTIHIKAFRDIPMADLEVVFPEKRISMRPLDLVKLTITGAMGVGVACAKLLSAAVGPILTAAAAGTVLAYAGKIFLGFKASKDRYQSLVTKSLYHKNLDNDLGVIFYLMDSLEEQEFKETVLSYYVLWREGEMTKEQLDRRCERLVAEQFGEEVDFEVDDAIQKLVRDELVVPSGDRYAARPLREALERLDAKWDDFFRWHRA